MWAPDTASYGYDSRAASIRILSAPGVPLPATRFEVRVPGADVSLVVSYIPQYITLCPFHPESISSSSDTSRPIPMWWSRGERRSSSAPIGSRVGESPRHDLPSAPLKRCFHPTPHLHHRPLRPHLPASQTVPFYLPLPLGTR